MACDREAPADDLVASSDAALRELAGALLGEVSERSGLAFHEPVRVEWRSEEELVRYLTYKLGEEFPGDEAELVRDSYALLGLVPPGLDLFALLLELYTEQVAGFYDPDSVALYVRSGQGGEALETVLVHELVHAAQDQVADLDALTGPRHGNDRRKAAQAAVEGQATLVMLEHALERRGAPADLAALPNFAELMGPALALAAGSSPALASAPRIVRESLVFPYVGGAAYVRALWRGRDGRPAPFGSFLPLSTEQVLEPERAIGPDPDAPAEIEVSGSNGVGVVHANARVVHTNAGVLDTSSRVVYTNSLGLAEIGILLEEVAGDTLPVRGWEGDRFALVEDAEGGRGLVWWSVWEDEAARDAFLARGQAVAAALDGATLEATVLHGRPAAVLAVGAVAAIPAASIPEGP